VRQNVEVGVSLGIQPTVDALDDRVRRFLGLGYRRIKLKIKPGADVPVVAEIRRRHPGPLSVDANAAYSLADAATCAADAFDLLMIEQPRPRRYRGPRPPPADPEDRDLPDESIASTPTPARLTPALAGS
jgi:L-alanine-DL-glutamate epimerase-like enolase superfamily enzyme